MNKQALFLDLDGTIRTSKSGKRFIQGPEDIVLLPNVEKSIWEYRRAEYLIFGISNQGGVAFGYKTEAEVLGELSVTAALFKKDPFHAIFYCPYHERATQEKYRRKSLSRKPHPGMLVRAEEWASLRMGCGIDWSGSLVVGDRREDYALAGGLDIDFQWASIFFSFCAQCYSSLGMLPTISYANRCSCRIFCQSSCVEEWVDEQK